MSDEVIVVLNLPAIQRVLAEYPAIAEPEWQAASDAALLGLVAPLSNYPSRSSSYVRTGQLGRGWAVARPEFSASSSGFEASLTNTTDYGAFVQGEEQAWMHQGVWQTAEQIGEQQRSQIEAEYRAAALRIEAIINKTTA